ncbi:uncharacterized protein LOC116023492 [Ipomoea triloba]|uniref:uncharacterized protein LOC116023492 n=1 Tax=Ipomoea triloba TaxID=35885 RepID=UPI00125E2654|nr:uncharacterized protein LOC116023492 [Ipomoea triloba]
MINFTLKKDINQYMELKFVYASFINDGDDISRSAIFKDRSLSTVLIGPLFVVFDHTSWNRSMKVGAECSLIPSSQPLIIILEADSSVEISSRVLVNPTFSVFNRNSWSSESLRLVNPLCIVVLVNTTASEKGDGSIAKMWSRSTKKNWSTLIEFFVPWFFLAGKQVFPVNYEDEVSQREASHSNDLAATLECLQDSFADVNFVGDVCLKVRKAEVVLREESPNEIGYEEFKTDVTALFLAVHNGNVALVRKLLSIGADVNQKLFRGYSTSIAVRENHLEILEMLLKAGASQQVCEGALLEASCYGHARMDILVYYLQGGQVVCTVYEMVVVWVQNQLKQKVVKEKVFYSKGVNDPDYVLEVGDGLFEVLSTSAAKTNDLAEQESTKLKGNLSEVISKNVDQLKYLHSQVAEQRVELANNASKTSFLVNQLEVDLRMYFAYQELSSAFEKKTVQLLVGDVLWEMFNDTCKRLRIMKSSLLIEQESHCAFID